MNSRHKITDFYDIQDELGNGSFATVYRGVKKNSNELVAIKRINPSIQERIKESIRSEIEIMRSIKHPNVVELLEHKFSNGQIYLIMELCPLGDLSHFIKATKKSPERSNKYGGLNDLYFRHFLKQLASAFRVLRERGIVHRDLKPQNILLSNPATGQYKSSDPSVNLPILKVADFGFAKILPTETMTQTMCGSPLYMAPEVLKSESYDARSDLWSIGAVLYEMITGFVPFTAPGQVELLRRIQQQQDRIQFPDEKEISSALNIGHFNAPERSGIDKDVKSLIRGLLKQYPVDRMSFGSFFTHPAVVKGTKSLYEPSQSGLVTSFGSKFASVLKPSPLTSPKNSFEPPLRKGPIHNRSHSNDSKLVSIKNAFEESDPLEQEYVMIPSLLPVNKQPQFTSHTKTPSAPPNIDLKKERLDGTQIPSLDKKPRSLIVGEVDFNPDSSPQAVFQADPEDEDNQNGWTIGNEATSILSQAIDKATSMFNKIRGLSPPAIPTNSETENNAFPLQGESASPKESIFLKEVEEVACQAYGMSKLADTKLKETPYWHYSDSVFDPNIHKTNYELTKSESLALQEALLLYIRAMSLLKLGSDQTYVYLTSSPRDTRHSIRMARSIQWLHHKFTECHVKGCFIKDRLSTTGLNLSSADIDLLIFNYALETSKKFALNELTLSVVSEIELYQTCIWLVKSLDFRFQNEDQLHREVRDRKPTLLASLEYILAAHNEKINQTSIPNH